MGSEDAVFFPEMLGTQADGETFSRKYSAPHSCVLPRRGSTGKKSQINFSSRQ